MKSNIINQCVKLGEDCFSDIRNSISLFFNQFSVFINKKFSSKSSFLIFLGLYFLALFSLLRENVNYYDDIVRTAFGYKDWKGFSRYSSQYLSSFVHANKSFLADISPIPRLIAFFELSLASLYLLKGITGKREFTIFQIASALILGLNPYFLACLSYKYDCPYMALSVLCAVIPLIFIKHSKLFFIATVFCVLIICTSYQASLGILPMAVIFTLLSLYVKGERLTAVFKTGLLFSLSFVIGLIIFKSFIMIPVTGVVSNSIPPLTEIPQNFFENMKHYYSYLNRDCYKPIKYALGIGVFFVVILSVKECKNKFSAFIQALLALFLGALLTYAFYAILEKVEIAQRYSYGIGALIACIFIFTVSFKDLYITKICSLIVAWTFIVIASAYGNALVAQRDWEDFRMKAVIYDLMTVENNGKTLKYRIYGSVGFAPKTETLRQRYSVLNRLGMITFKNSESYWGHAKLDLFYGLKNFAVDNSITDTGTPKLVKENMYHQIKVFNDKVIITLK